MGQVVKYVAELYPRAVGIFNRPPARRLQVLLLLLCLGLVACLLIFYLALSGANFHPLGEAGGMGGIMEQLQLRLAAAEISLPALGLTLREPDADADKQVNTPDSNSALTEANGSRLTEAAPDPELPEPAGTAGTPLPENMEASPPPEELAQQVPVPAYVRSVAAAGKRVALTFDDGPHPEWTERYLRVLEATQTPATFFVIGTQAAARPELVQAVLAGGHEVASHSWRHANLSEVSQADAEADLGQAVSSLEEITGAPVKYFRPPYGALSPHLLAAADKIGVRTVNWSVDPRDWSNPGPQVIIQRVMDNVFAGSIILLHEARPGTLTALPLLIKELRDQGYELVTVSDLIASGQARQD